MISPFFILIATLFFLPSPVVSPLSSTSPLWVNDGSVQATSTSLQRCSVKNCTCKVTRGTVTPAPVTEVSDKYRYLVYFLENEYELDENQERQIKLFASQYSRTSRVDVTLVGYTDGCGSHEDNHILSANRARVVTEQIKRVLPNAKVSFSAAGEQSVTHDPRSRRVDIVVKTSSNLEVSIAKVEADVYLIDASGSLWNGWDGWTNIINSSFKPGSKIYVSKMHGCHNGMSLDAVKPSGGTEIWYSYWTVLATMKAGQTLAVISDFDSNYPLRAWEHAAIEKRVREKNIRVVVIRL